MRHSRSSQAPIQLHVCIIIVMPMISIYNLMIYYYTGAKQKHQCTVSVAVVWICISCTALLTIATSVQATFNYTKCPTPWELQSDIVKNNFSIKKFEGSYYEIAFHDFTQFPICPIPKCMRSHKVMNYQTNQINDTFVLNCFGFDFPFTFLFNLTNTNGFFLGRVAHSLDIIFPDTVVDVHEGPDGVYDWVIEFQCFERFQHVWFVGINWYSRIAKVTDGCYESMMMAARARGLGFYMDSGLKVTRVDQNCTKHMTLYNYNGDVDNVQN